MSIDGYAVKEFSESEREPYCQCRVVQRTELGFRYDWVWVHARFAVVGKQIRLDGEEGVWTVEEHGEPRMLGIVRQFEKNGRRAIKMRSCCFL